MDVTGTPPANPLVPRNKRQLIALATAAGRQSYYHSPILCASTRLLDGMRSCLGCLRTLARYFSSTWPSFAGRRFSLTCLLWAPKPDTDQEYRQFVGDTGFDYEKVSDRLAVAFEQQGAQKIFFAVGEGHFDKKKSWRTRKKWCGTEFWRRGNFLFAAHA